mgnify:CR=1 FL=1
MKSFRQKEMIEMLSKEGMITTTAAAKHFGVSIETIRRDLLYMEQNKLLRRVHGGAVTAGEMLPFHNGVFKIAQKADAPIVVLSIAGTEKIAKRTPFKPTDVYLDVLEVFPSENIQGIKTETIGMMARHLIAMSIKKRDNLWQLDM